MALATEAEIRSGCTGGLIAVVIVLSVLYFTLMTKYGIKTRLFPGKSSNSGILSLGYIFSIQSVIENAAICCVQEPSKHHADG